MCNATVGMVHSVGIACIHGDLIYEETLESTCCTAEYIVVVPGVEVESIDHITVNHKAENDVVLSECRC